MIPPEGTGATALDKRYDRFWLAVLVVALIFCNLAGVMFIALYVESLALFAPFAWWIIKDRESSSRESQSMRGFLRASLIVLGVFFAVSVGYALGVRRPLFW